MILRNAIMMMLVVFTCNNPLTAATFYVSPQGNDSHSGTVDQPLKTFAAAVERCRPLAGKQPVEVIFEKGIYYLPETIVLRSEDGGTEQYPVVYRSRQPQQAVISGGQHLDLSWQPYKNSIYKAATPSGLNIDQLFVNGKRQHMARYPDYNPEIFPYNGYAADAFSKERAARWSDPAGGFIHAMHRARWGGYHYRITGKKDDNTILYEGGWQNNRQMGMHKKFRFVENIFEELDAPGEWYHNSNTHTLYFYPLDDTDIKTSKIEIVRLRHLIEFQGTPRNPVRNITLDGFTFRHTARTFMDTKEPLLRSDWTIYRGGAILFKGAEECRIIHSDFVEVGGNAVFVDDYNRRLAVNDCHIVGAGASGVCFVGSPDTVRNPLFEYHERQHYNDIDKRPGPKSNRFPSDCMVENCLIHKIGVFEKQATGVQISMSRNITIRHCSIYEVGRAGINFSEGTFGGHLIEFCDVFDTVKETGDHGSFNSWGRDRFWRLEGAPPEEMMSLAMLDTDKTIIRNSRWRCDHGWDIDLDDGSSNYEIYNNLMLRGGLKLREGLLRIVHNNVIINNSLHPHVWTMYPDSGDVFTRNIVMNSYRPAGGMPKGKWGHLLDHNLFYTDQKRMHKYASHDCDLNSRIGDPLFVNQAAGDFRVREDSPALELGFKNFPMDRFGVQTPRLKAIARTPAIPELQDRGYESPAATTTAETAGLWLGAKVKLLSHEEYSAYGVSQEDGGICLIDVPADSPAAQHGFLNDDVVVRMNNRPVKALKDLPATPTADQTTIHFVRNQQLKKRHINALTH